MARSPDRNAEKCTASIDVPMGEQLFDAVVAAATIRRMSKAEYVRNVLEQHFFGELGRMQRILGERDDEGNPTNLGSRSST